MDHQDNGSVPGLEPGVRGPRMVRVTLPKACQVSYQMFENN